MHIPKNYFHDRVILLLLSVLSFLSVLCFLMIFLRLDTGRGDSYIVQYRSNLGLDEFKTGGVIEPVSLAVFALVVLVSHAILSTKSYNIKRRFAIAILGLGILLVALAIIISNSLLILR